MQWRTEERVVPVPLSVLGSGSNRNEDKHYLCRQEHLACGMPWRSQVVSRTSTVWPGECQGHEEGSRRVKTAQRQKLNSNFTRSTPLPSKWDQPRQKKSKRQSPYSRSILPLQQRTMMNQTSGKHDQFILYLMLNEVAPRHPQRTGKRTELRHS